jgi:peptide/nickel transport system ATP-binding protein
MTAPTLAAPDTTTAVLEARSLTKHFAVHGHVPDVGRRLVRRGRPAPVVHAVDDVSLVLSAGAVTAVVGESGSGKSTLARLLARLTTPTSGELLLRGRAVPRTQRRRLDYAKAVQMVLQDPFASLNPIHNVQYHLSRPFKVHGPAGSGADLGDMIAAVLERVSLTPADAFIHKYPHELSGGQRQRVAIARALAVQPRVLVADEPVSMLDVSIRLGVLNLLADLRDRDQLAILYITHDIASARYLADTILVMYAGQVVESGPAVQVTDSPAHPYTQLLLSAAPDPTRVTPVTLRGAGAPPSALAPPSGCRFRLRCPHAMAICAEQKPPAFTAGDGHLSACWLLSGDHETAAALSQSTTPAPATTAGGEASSRFPAKPGRRSAGPGAGQDTPDNGREEVMSTEEL